MSAAKNRIFKLGLGTVQFGLDYGISNREGQTPEDEVCAILERAHDAGVRVLDTAAMYGESEKVLGATLPFGRNFKIITKTRHFETNHIGFHDAECLKNTFYDSIENLRTNHIYALMIHNADDLLLPGGEHLYNAMLDIKNKGLIEKIGVSVYDAGQIERILEKYDIEIIQAPVNLLDQRLISGGHLRELKRRGVEIHARSVFLQGALLMTPGELPEYFEPVRKHLEEFHTDCKANHVTPLAACLDFVSGIDEVDCAVVGVCSGRHLEGIIEAVSEKRRLGNYGKYAWTDEKILNPSKWKKTEDEPNVTG